MTGRVGQRIEQVTARYQVVAQLPDFGAEGIWRDEAADVVIADYLYRLKHINILAIL